MLDCKPITSIYIFCSFDAERCYAELFERRNHTSNDTDDFSFYKDQSQASKYASNKPEEWFFFKDFKMELYNCEVARIILLVYIGTREFYILCWQLDKKLSNWFREFSNQIWRSPIKELSNSKESSPINWIALEVTEDMSTEISIVY